MSDFAVSGLFVLRYHIQPLGCTDSSVASSVNTSMAPVMTAILKTKGNRKWRWKNVKENITQDFCSKLFQQFSSNMLIIRLQDPTCKGFLILRENIFLKT